MAQIIPHDFEHLEGLLSNEVATLKMLKEKLPGDLSVYHNVYWTKSFNSKSIFGEIDFVLLSKDGIVLAIEQKDINVIHEDGDLFAHYQSGKKNVTSQILRNIGNLRTEFRRRNHNKDLFLDYLLYLPNSQISAEVPSNIDRNNIVDAQCTDGLCERVTNYFNEARTNSRLNKNDFYEVAQFFSSKIGVLPEIGLIGEELFLKTRRLADGLATWGSRLEISPHRLHVRGTAGSGKTQLAFSEMQRAMSEKKELLYLCYNRLLSESISKLIVSEVGYRPENIHIFNIHQFANVFCEKIGIKSTNGQENSEDFFNKMLQNFFLHADQLKGIFDILIIDEGQDLTMLSQIENNWLDRLMLLAKPSSRIFFMEDPSQSIYSTKINTRDESWPLINSPVNYRSPRNVVQLINNLSLSDKQIESGNHFGGYPFDIRVYSEDNLIDKTFSAVLKLREAGFDLDKIVVITYKGSESSIFYTNKDTREKDGISLKYYKGIDSKSDTPIFSQGNCRLETLYRFKGQAASAIVITEVDIADLDNKNKKKLFVALTRARLSVSLVVSEKSSEIFSEILGFDFNTLT